MNGTARIATAIGVLTCSTGWAQVMQRVSLAPDGSQGDDLSVFASISTSGRYVAFHSLAANLVPDDTNQSSDVFVRDLWTGTTQRASVDSNGIQADGASYEPSLSADGRYVAFSSFASNLVADDTNNRGDVFVRDVWSGITIRVSVDSAGVEGNDDSTSPRISASGRFIVFPSSANNLVADDANAVIDVFVFDRADDTTERASVAWDGAEPNDTSDYPSISGDGRYVVFRGFASNLVPDDTNGATDVFLRDRQARTTQRVSVDSSGIQGNDHSDIARISTYGGFVVFDSLASNLVPGDTNGGADVFLRDLLSGTTDRVSLDSHGFQVDAGSYVPVISPDGRFVAFSGLAANLVPGDANGRFDVFVRDRQSGTTERVSVDSNGLEGDGDSSVPAISSDGRFVAFESSATNLVPSDSNGDYDVFVHDRAASSFSSFCHPGVDVPACPCSNPPSFPGRGCDNSAGTGGAVLAALGAAYLSQDSLVFTTGGERPTALSVLMQGNGYYGPGNPIGQGMRCVGGTIIRRLFIKTASGGSITAPQFATGDPSISERSSEMGDPILPAQARFYLVWYRDPIVLGGCSASSTFNTTQTGQVFWLP